MSAHPCCPHCGGTLTLVTDGRIGRAVVSSSHRRDAAVPILWQRGTFASCDGCEFCIEVHTHRKETPRAH